MGLNAKPENSKPKPIFCVLEAREATLALAAHALQKRGIRPTGKVEVRLIMTMLKDGELAQVRLEILNS